jgi:hypothetical protein
MPAITTKSPGGLNVGNKPSVSNLIVLVGDQDAPITKSIGRAKATAVLHSWITDNIPEPVNAPQLEIAGPPAAPESTKQKTSNACQIFKTTASVSYDQQASAVYGNTTEAAWQQKLASIKHFKSIEAAVVGWRGSAATAKADVLKPPTERVANSTAGIMAGLPYFIANVNGATAFNASGRRGNILAIDDDKDWTGVAQPLTKAIIEDFVQIPYESNADMKTIYLGVHLKESINALFGREWTNEKRVNWNVTEIDTSVGVVQLKLHRYLTPKYGLGDVMIGGDFEFAKLAVLHERKEKLVDNVTADTWQLYSSLTLQVSNAAAFAMLVGAAA